MKLLKFGAKWCGACTMVDKTLEDFADNELVKGMEYIDIDIDMPRTIQYGVRSVPTMMIVDDAGVEVRRMVGMYSKPDIEAFLNA